MTSTPPSPAAATVESALTGLVPFVFAAEMARTDPEVFIAAAQTADTQAYGMLHRPSSDGSGAGLSYSAARAAAIGECVERYACSVMHPEQLWFGSYREAVGSGRDVVAPERWALFAPEQHDASPFAPFTDTTPLAWVPAADLSARREVLVPACLVYMPYVPHFAERGEREIAHAISTGAACAPSAAEALLKGICELIERDAFMIMWRNQLRCPQVRIDPRSRLAPLFERHFARPGLRYHLVQTTLDLGVPSFCGLLIDERRDPPAILVGGAAHPDPERAALKTLLELVQGLKWLDHLGTQPIDPGPDFANIHTFEERVRLYAFSDMRAAVAFLLDQPQTIDLSSIPSLERGSTRQTLDGCLALLAERGLRPAAVDLTSVDVEACGYRVVKVLIPECETMEADHRLPFLGGHRWREVPRQCGWNRTGQLNPFPHPYP
jgi:ribosomal protein S12 methylthiotransferase accessory factor